MKISAAVQSQKESNFERINANAAGIDIGSGEHWVCVPAERAEPNVRRFCCFTPDLIAMADWLLECQVDTVAMEATGVYWIPLFQILEAKGLDVNLKNSSSFVGKSRGQGSDRFAYLHF
jgi:transposase